MLYVLILPDLFNNSYFELLIELHTGMILHSLDDTVYEVTVENSSYLKLPTLF